MKHRLVVQDEAASKCSELSEIPIAFSFKVVLFYAAKSRGAYGTRPPVTFGDLQSEKDPAFQKRHFWRVASLPRLGA